jgi:hypothetical protein
MPTNTRKNNSDKIATYLAMKVIIGKFLSPALSEGKGD